VSPDQRSLNHLIIGFMNTNFMNLRWEWRW